MSNLTAIEIFKNVSFNKTTLEVEAFGGEIIVQELSARQASKVIELIETNALRSNALAVAYGVITEDGKRVFTDAQVDKIMDKVRVNDISRIAVAVMQLSDPESDAEKS